MRIAVIGETGQLARRLAVVGNKRNIIFLGRDRIDLSKPNTVRQPLVDARPDVIINAAAYTAVDRAEDERDLAFAVNCYGAAEAARVADSLSAPFLQVSTDYVFDGTKDSPYVETDPVAPLGVYGESKLAGEDAVRAATHRHLIVRTAWLYAAEGKNFVTTMLRLGAERRSIQVVADQFGSPTCADDLARFLLGTAEKCADQNARAERFGTVHFAGKGATNWAEFAETIFDRAVAYNLLATAPKVERILTKDYPTRAPRPCYSALTCAKAACVFGCEPHEWRAALNLVLAERACTA